MILHTVECAYIGKRGIKQVCEELLFFFSASQNGKLPPLSRGSENNVIVSFPV